MEVVEISIKAPPGEATSGYRPTEMVADLRNAAETLYFPMKAVGYWDIRTGDHRCPQAQLRSQCPHLLPNENPKHVDYQKTVERDLDAVLDVYFAHGQVHVYMA